MLSYRHSFVALLLGLSLLAFAAATPAGPVNINTADAATLAKELSGIGLKRAQAIVDYRQKHGPFRSPDELGLVKGIGPAAIAKNRDIIRTDGKPAADSVSKGAATPAPRPTSTRKTPASSSNSAR